MIKSYTLNAWCSTFYSNENFTDNGWINFGKSLEKLPELHEIYLYFD